MSQVLAIPGMAALVSEIRSGLPSHGAGSNLATDVAHPSPALDTNAEVVFLGTSSAVPHKYRNGTLCLFGISPHVPINVLSFVVTLHVARSEWDPVETVATQLCSP